MPTNKFMTPAGRVMRQPRIATLAKRRLELKQEMASLERRLREVEAQLLIQVGQDTDAVDNRLGHWYEHKIRRVEFSYLDQDLVKNYLTPQQLRRCTKTGHKVVHYTSEVSGEYAKEAYAGHFN